MPSFDGGTFAVAYDVAIVVVSLEIAATTFAIQGGTSVQFTATATYNDSSTADVTTQVTWSSSNPAVLNIAADGTAQAGFAAGSATITAVLP